MKQLAVSQMVVLLLTIVVFSLIIAGCTAPVQDSLAADWRLTDAIKAEIDRIFEEEGVPTYRDAPQAT